MKKIFLSLLALIAMGSSVMAGDKPVVTVADVEALPGETVSFAVNLVDGKADTYTAMTLYAYFPTEGFTTTGTYTVASAWVGPTGVVGDINTTTGLATIPFVSANAITGSEVNNLVTVSFTVGNSVAVGEYPITLKATMFEYNLSDKDYADDITFNVKVGNMHSVVLDESSTTPPAASNEPVNVRVKRTINANEWSTICLPFAMSAAQVAEAFGSDAEIGDFSGCDTDDATGNIKVKFVPTTVIAANHPYIIRVSQPVTEFTVDGVDIVPDDALSIDKNQTGSGSDQTFNSFIGNYVNGTEIPDYAMFLYGNKFNFSTGKTKIKAFRGYFDFATAGAKYGAARLLMVVDEPTVIESLETERIEEVYYNVNGQKVNTPAKGIYIKEGKKVVVK